MTRQKYKHIAILVIVGLALIELAMLGISFWRRQETLASENASEMLVRLSMADSALRSGDQAKFESMRNEFDSLRKKMERNIFAKTHYGAVIELADSYIKRISDDELIGELRLFLHARDNLLNDIASLNQDEYNYENQLKLKDYLADYAQVLNDLKVQQITDLVNAQKNATQAQRDAVENLLSCTGACTDADYIERQRQFEDALAQNLPIFEAQNDIFAEKFGASELAAELSKIAKNS